MDHSSTSRGSESPYPLNIFGVDGPVVDPVVDEFIPGVGRIMCDLNLEVD